MIIKHTDPESLEASLYRQAALGKESMGALPIIIVVIVLALLAALFIGTNGQNVMLDSYGIGNPYSCKTCKDLRRACDEHKNYESDKALMDKINLITDRYSADMPEDEAKFALYGYGNLYNTECDFCNAEEKECYSCSYDRKYIIYEYTRISESDVFITKLCDDCWKEKKVSCGLCKEKLGLEIFKSIKKEDS